MENKEILEKIQQSDKILVGLGEEFDNIKRLRQISEYTDGCKMLMDQGFPWLIPAWNTYWSEKLGDGALVSALDRLFGLLEGKDYFVVSTSVNSRIARADRKIVMPCGSDLKKQCAKGCGEVLQDVTEEDREKMQKGFGDLSHLAELSQFGVCPVCGTALVINNIYAENYNENGYLGQWDLYTKWLQGTLNHQLLVLELGVGMQFPSVIRWPFEKAAFFNQKAFFCRVNEKLYQLAEELAGKGCGISLNVIDWLNQL